MGLCEERKLSLLFQKERLLFPCYAQTVRNRLFLGRNGHFKLIEFAMEKFQEGEVRKYNLRKNKIISKDRTEADLYNTVRFLFCLMA